MQKNYIEQQFQTESRPKHREKSSVLRRHLKANSDVDEVTLDGRLFHTRKAATGNAQSPMVVWRVGGKLIKDEKQNACCDPVHLI